MANEANESARESKQQHRDASWSAQHEQGYKWMDEAERAGHGMADGVTHVATDLVHGVGTVGAEVVNVVRDTANMAITGIGSVGGTALHTVSGFLSELASGIREVGGAARHGRYGGEVEHEQQKKHEEKVTHH